MDQSNKQNFRALCLREYEQEQLVEEMALKEQQDKDREQQERDNAERHQKLVEFLDQILLDHNIEAKSLEITDAVYQDGRFFLTVGFKDDGFPAIASVECERCDAVFKQEEVKDLAQIGAMISLASDMKCPNCDEDEDDFESSSPISRY